MHKSARFLLSSEGELYRRSFGGPYLKVVHSDQVSKLLHELHEGSYGMHTGGRSLAHEALTQGYWWLTMEVDAVKYTMNCQQFAPNIHQPPTPL